MTAETLPRTSLVLLLSRRGSGHRIAADTDRRRRDGCGHRHIVGRPGGRRCPGGRGQVQPAAGLDAGDVDRLRHGASALGEHPSRRRHPGLNRRVDRRRPAIRVAGPATAFRGRQPAPSTPRPSPILPLREVRRRSGVVPLPLAVSRGPRRRRRACAGANARRAGGRGFPFQRRAQREGDQTHVRPGHPSRHPHSPTSCSPNSASPPQAVREVVEDDRAMRCPDRDTVPRVGGGEALRPGPGASAGRMEWRGALRG